MRIEEFELMREIRIGRYFNLFLAIVAIICLIFLIFMHFSTMATFAELDAISSRIAEVGR